MIPEPEGSTDLNCSQSNSNTSIYGINIASRTFMSRTIRLSICDHCPAVRYGLRHIFSDYEDFKIVSEASAQSEILATADGIETDILLTDLKPNAPEDIKHIREFRELRPNVKIIIFSDCSDHRMVMETLEIGIQGFRSKDAEAD